MKIYTTTGDQGETGLFGGRRVLKDHDRIEAYGAVDEINAFLGQARALGLASDLDAVLAHVQNDLFTIGGDLATPEEARVKQTQPLELRVDDIRRLEQAIDRLDAELPPLHQFILPGGTAIAAALHVARTVARRAERRVVSLAQGAQVHPQVIVYLNRLSDLLFVMARTANHRAGLPDVPWRKP